MKSSIFRLALFLTLLTSCHDDEPTPNLKVMEEYLTQAGFTEVSEKIDFEDREFGIKFIPVVDGEIPVAFIVLPADVEEIRLTLWDVEQKQVLETGVLGGIRPITAGDGVGVMMQRQVIAGKEYMLTINSNDWFEYKGTGEATYPIQVGDIMITGFGYAVGTDLTFPTEFPTSYFAGNLDFSFKAD